MKFGRLLQDFDANRSSGAKRPRNNDGESSPCSPFIGYKRMKKVLKQANTAKEAGDHELMRQLEREFVDQLHEGLEEINSSFIEQEEDAREVRRKSVVHVNERRPCGRLSRKSGTRGPYLVLLRPRPGHLCQERTGNLFNSVRRTTHLVRKKARARR